MPPRARERTFGSMDDPARDHETALSCQLDVNLDRRPVTGRIRTPDGADERFVGWLDFIDAMKRVEQRSAEHPPKPKEQ
jgi:hypothetical protein